MRTPKSKILIALSTLGFLVYVLSGPVAAAETAGKIADADAAKTEGSSSKNPPSGSDKGGYSHEKAEGSGGMMSPHGGQGYSGHGKAEGSDSKGHSYGVSGKGHGDPFSHVLRFKDKLGLTPEQVAGISKLEFEYKKQSIQSSADHEIAHVEMDRLAHAETIDEAGMRALADRIGAIKSKEVHAMVEAKIAMLKILTDAQRKKVSEMHMAR